MLTHSFTIFFYCIFHHVQSCIILNRCWVFVLLPLEYFTNNVAKDFSTSGFWKFLDHHHMLKSCYWTDFLSYQGYKFLLYSFPGIANLKNNKAYRNLPFQLLNLSNNSSLVDPRMSKQSLFHSTSRQPMTSSIDDIIKSGGNIKIAIIIKISSISSSIISRSLVHILIKKSLIIIKECTHK